MKTEKKFLMKIISALCAAAVFSITPGFVSANPKKTSQNNINKTTKDNQSTNIIINNNNDINTNNTTNNIINNDNNTDDNITNNDNIRQIIIDKDSEDESGKIRNNDRKHINFTILYSLGLKSKNAIDDMFDCRYAWDKCGLANNEIKKISKNKFDRFLYCNISGLIYSQNRIIDPLYKFINSKNCHEDEKFNFPSTKIALANKLIDQENDLIKQLLLQIICQNILNIRDKSASSNEFIHNPYECKVEMEKRYLEWLKEYSDENDFHDENFDIKWLRQYCDSDDVKNYIEDCQAKSEAFVKALDDVINEAKTDVKEKSKNYQDTYNQTYAFALAEIDVKNRLKRRQNLDENVQKFYSRQYNEVASQMGQNDGKNIKSLYKYEDQEAQNFYDKGYFLGVLENARDDVSFDKFNINKYEEKAKDMYIEAYKKAVYELGFFCFKNSNSPKIGLRFLKNLQNDNNNATCVDQLTETLKAQYIEGCFNGCRMRGRKYAATMDPFYSSDSLKESELGQHYFEFKKSYDEGFKEALPEKQSK